MKKLFALVLATALVMGLATGCAGTPPSAAENSAAPAPTSQSTAPAETNSDTAPAELPHFGLLTYRADDNFISFCRRLIEEMAQGKATLTVLDANGDMGKQTEQVDLLISKKVNGIIVNLVDKAGAKIVTEKCKAAGIPVTFLCTEPDPKDIADYDKAFFAGPLSPQPGEAQANYLMKLFEEKPELDKNKDGKIQYVYLKGLPGNAHAEGRCSKFIEVMGDKGDQLDLQVAFWETQKAKDIMDAWIPKFGDKIEAVISGNDAQAMGAIQALKAQGYFTEGGKYVPVLGVDAIPEALESLKDGTLAATVINDAKGQSEACFLMCMNMAQGKDPMDGLNYEMGADKFILLPGVLITTDNIDVAETAYK